MRYTFIREHAAQYPVTQLCQTLHVARSGYYAWQRPSKRPRTQANQHLLAAIQAAYTMSKATYGSARIHAQLQREGLPCGRHRVARLMRRQGLVAKTRRAYRVTTDATHALPVADNLLDRQFAPTHLNQVWVSDITYVATREGWLYLAVVLDLASRRVVGWAMAPQIDTALVQTALTMALAARQPAPGLLHHSDRGRQYASAAYQATLARHGIQPSMSRKGNCWDNAPMESFFHSLKSECLTGQTFSTRAAARQTIFAYIAVWYNRHRLHSTLGYRTPEEYERLQCP